MDSHQVTFANKRRDMMIEQVDEQLRVEENQKRKRTTTDEYAGSRKRVDIALDVPAVNGLDYGMSASMQLGLTALSENAQRSTTLSAEVQENGRPQFLETRESEDQLSSKPGADLPHYDPISDLAIYDAPVHSEINWLSWIHQTNG